jgi:GNAT superfamily N-acetyltransferase
MNLKTLYVLPEYQGFGYAQQAIKLVEKLHYEVDEWRLDTILQEVRNCNLYEKMGYAKTGEVKTIKNGMDLVYYKKIMCKS